MTLAEMTWCTMALKRCIIGVGKGSTSKETFPVRYLFPFSVCASVRNLLRHLIVNKNQIPQFSLIHGLAFVYFFLLPFEKLQWLLGLPSRDLGSFSLFWPWGNYFLKKEIAPEKWIRQNCLWDSTETKMTFRPSSWLSFFQCILVTLHPDGLILELLRKPKMHRCPSPFYKMRWYLHIPYACLPICLRSSQGYL